MARKNIKKATKKTVKAKQNSVASSKTARALRARHLQSICVEIESRRSSNGRVPRGEITKVLNENKSIYTWLTVDIIKKALKTFKGKCNSNLETVISDLADGTGNTGTTVVTDAPPILPPSSTIGFLNPETNKKKVGRPKGSSAQAARIELETQSC
jgi:hypothetical protein